MRGCAAEQRLAHVGQHLAAAAAHDLRDPLQTIAGFTRRPWLAIIIQRRHCASERPDRVHVVYNTLVNNLAIRNSDPETMATNIQAALVGQKQTKQALDDSQTRIGQMLKS